LLHPFLLSTFARLGGTPNLLTQQVTPTVNRLRKRARREASFDVRVDGERQALANLIVKAAQEVKSPSDFVSYDDFKEKWETHRAAYWAAHPQQNALGFDVDWDLHERKSLDACLIAMRQRKMLFQGHQWACRNCHHKNWVDLSALTSELSCEVCKERRQ